MAWVCERRYELGQGNTSMESDVTAVDDRELAEE